MKRFLDILAVLPVRSGSIAAVTLLFVLTGSVVFTGCATTRHNPQPLPPILAQDELRQSYTKIGVVECTRDSFGTITGLTPADYDWAHGELREAARRLGADAVITPELRVEQNTFLLFPTSTVKAKGIAIRFR